MSVWVVLIAAASSFVVGGLWYSPLLFGKVWNAENGGPPPAGHPARVFGVSFAFAVAAAACFAVLVGPSPELSSSIKLGALVGAGLVGASFGINYQFAQRTFKLWIIDSGYHIAQFILFGVVYGLLG